MSREKPVVKCMPKIHVEKISGVRTKYFSQKCCCCSVAKSCLTPYDLTVACQAPLPSSVSCMNPPIHVCWVGNYLILCGTLFLLPSIFLSISLFQWVDSSHLVAKGVELLIQQQSFQWIFRVDFLQNWLVWSPCSWKGLSRVFSSTTIRKHKFFCGQPSLWSNSHICTWLLGKL